MKLTTFTKNGISSIGAILEDKIVDLHVAYKALLESEGVIRAAQIADAYVPTDMAGYLQGGEDSRNRAEQAIEYALNNDSKYELVYNTADVEIGAPVTNPGKIICVGHNYRDHILEMGRELPPQPVVFAKFANTIIGPTEDIPFYPIDEKLDYEAEFAFVMGKRAKNVSEEDALNYVAGYAVSNDVTYRTFQRRTLQWLQGKTVDGSLPMGPYLITTDEVPNPSGLEMVLTVNGEERQRANTDNLVFSVEKLVAFLSNIVTLEPGDIILTGTPGGVGFARDPQVFLKDGDVVKVEIEQIGAIENKVATVK